MLDIYLDEMNYENDQCTSCSVLLGVFNVVCIIFASTLNCTFVSGAHLKYARHNTSIIWFEILSY